MAATGTGTVRSVIQIGLFPSSPLSLCATTRRPSMPSAMALPAAFRQLQPSRSAPSLGASPSEGNARPPIDPTGYAAKAMQRKAMLQSPQTATRTRTAFARRASTPPQIRSRLLYAAFEPNAPAKAVVVSPWTRMRSGFTIFITGSSLIKTWVVIS